MLPSAGALVVLAPSPASLDDELAPKNGAALDDDEAPKSGAALEDEDAAEELLLPPVPPPLVSAVMLIPIA